MGTTSTSVQPTKPVQPELVFRDSNAWRRWLHKNHTDPTGIWLNLAKKNVTEPTSLTYDQALDIALCYGWVDGQVKRKDEATYLQRWTPRRTRSPWSTRNVGIVARLIEEGLMQPAGLAEIERAKADGRWEAAYAGPATAEVPADLAVAIAAEPKAAAMFEVLTSQNRFAMIYRLGQAKRPETRARLLTTYVEMLVRGETLYPQKRTLSR